MGVMGMGEVVADIGVAIEVTVMVVMAEVVIHKDKHKGKDREDREGFGMGSKGDDVVMLVPSLNHDTSRKR